LLRLLESRALHGLYPSPVGSSEADESVRLYNGASSILSGCSSDRYRRFSVPISHFPYTGFEQTSQNGGRNYNERAGRFIQKICEDCECKKIELGDWASHPNSLLHGVNKKDDVGLWKKRGPRSIPTLSTLKHETVPKIGEKFVGA
jgi:hypothetical protein